MIEPGYDPRYAASLLHRIGAELFDFRDLAIVFGNF
jgi:hypothetical protein